MSDAGSYAGSYAGSAAGDRKEMLDESVREAKRELQEAMRAYQKATAELKAAGGDPASDAERRLPPKSAWNMHTLDATERAHSRKPPAFGSGARLVRRTPADPPPGTSRASASDADAYQPRAGSLLEGRTHSRKPPPFGSKGAARAGLPGHDSTFGTSYEYGQRSFDHRFHSVNPPPFGSGVPRFPKQKSADLPSDLLDPEEEEEEEEDEDDGGAAARAVDRELQSSSLDIQRRRSPPPRSPPPRKPPPKKAPPKKLLPPKSSPEPSPEPSEAASSAGSSPMVAPAFDENPFRASPSSGEEHEAAAPGPAAAPEQLDEMLEAMAHVMAANYAGLYADDSDEDA